MSVLQAWEKHDLKHDLERRSSPSSLVQKEGQVVRIQYLPQAPQVRNGGGDAQAEAEAEKAGLQEMPAARAQEDCIPAHIQLYVSEISGIGTESVRTRATESVGTRGAWQQSALGNETMSARELWSATPSPSPAPRPHCMSAMSAMSVDSTPVPHAVSLMLSPGGARAPRNTSSPAYTGFFLFPSFPPYPLHSSLPPPSHLPSHASSHLALPRSRAL